MRTTLDLPDSLFKEVKTRAVQKGVTLKELLASFIEAGLRSSTVPQNATNPAGKRRPLPVGIPRIPDAPLHPALSNAELYSVLEEEDVANYHRVISQSSKPE
jgi:hypothetical protein